MLDLSAIQELVQRRGEGQVEVLGEYIVDNQQVHAFLLADHADTLVGEAVMMVSGNMTLEQVGNAIHPHPTQTELFGELARRLASRLRRSARVKVK